MAKRELFVGALTLAALLLAPAEGRAQGGMPPIPDRKEIEKRIREAMPKLLEASPETVVEVKGIVKLTYKAIPTEPKEIAKLLGKDLTGGQNVPQQQIDQYIGMFQNEINEALNELMKDVGKLEVTREIKIKSKEIPPGEHRIGVVFDGERPVALRVFDPEDADDKKLEKPVDIRLKTRSVDLQEALAFELKEPKKQKEGKETFEIRMSCVRFLAKSSKIKVSKSEDEEDEDEDEE